MPPNPLEAKLDQAVVLQAARRASLDNFRECARHPTPANDLEERRREEELKDADNDILRLRLELKDEETRRLLARQEQRDLDMKAEMEVQNQRILEHNRRVLHRSNIAISISVLVALGGIISHFTRHEHAQDTSQSATSRP